LEQVSIAHMGHFYAKSKPAALGEGYHGHAAIITNGVQEFLLVWPTDAQFPFAVPNRAAEKDLSALWKKTIKIS
jgi:hypothetical protein